MMFTPIPSAKERTATLLNPGCLKSWRKACLMCVYLMEHQEKKHAPTSDTLSLAEEEERVGASRSRFRGQWPAVLCALRALCANPMSTNPPTHQPTNPPTHQPTNPPKAR